MRGVACTITLVRHFVVWATLGLSACAPTRPAADPLGGTSLNDPEGSAQRGLDPTKVDAPKLEALFAERVDQAWERPAVDRAMEELLTSLGDDPALEAQGEALFQALGQDARLLARAEALQESLSEEPAMVALVMRLMAEHPGAGPDEIGELAGKHVEQQTESPAFDEAFDFAIDRLFERPRLTAAFEDFGAAVANNPQFERGMAAVFHGIDYRPLEERVRAVNGGKEPDAAVATQILIDRAFTVDRIETLIIEWLNLPETRSELRRLASDLLQAPSFRKRAVALSTELLSDPEVQQGLRESFLVLLDAHPDAAEMKETFRDALDTPRIDAALASFMAELIADPALQTLGARFLERMTESKAFAASMQRFMTDW